LWLREVCNLIWAETF